jgi:hypothetical protein
MSPDVPAHRARLSGVIPPLVEWEVTMRVLQSSRLSLHAKKHGFIVYAADMFVSAVIMPTDWRWFVNSADARDRSSSPRSW